LAAAASLVLFLALPVGHDVFLLVLFLPEPAAILAV
jgi:hypothetical protein